VHPETRFKNRIRPKLEALPYCFVIKIQQAAIRGDPDFVLCIRGFFFSLELKRNHRAKAEPLQEWKLERAQAAKGISLVVSPENWEICHSYLNLFAKTGCGRKEVPPCLLKFRTRRYGSVRSKSPTKS